MDIKLEKVGELTGKLIVSVVADDYNTEVTKQLKEIARNNVFPGFRKGHVPASIVSRRFGRDVKSDVINHAVYKAVVNYIQENKLNILGEPLPVEIKEVSMEVADYTFEYELGFSPEINIDLTSDTIPFYNITVDDKMVDEQDKTLRERFGAQVDGEEVTEKAVIKGTVMELDEEGKIKEGEDAVQSIESTIYPFYFTDADEKAKFMGKKVGDKVTFNPSKSCGGNTSELTSMLGITAEKAATLTSDFEFAISKITVVKPAEDGEEFFNNAFGPDKVHNHDEYVAALKSMIAAQLAPNSNTLFRIQAEKYLTEKYGNFDMPVEFLKKWLVNRNEELTADNIDEEFEKMIPALKWELIQGRISQNLEINVEEKDVVEFAKGYAYNQFAQYGMGGIGDEMIQGYAERLLEDKKFRSHAAEQVNAIKLFNGIRAKVNLDEKTVSLDEFKAIAEEAQK